MNKEKQGKLPDQKELDEVFSIAKPAVSEEERIENEVRIRTSNWIRARSKANEAKHKQALKIFDVTFWAAAGVIAAMYGLYHFDMIPLPVALAISSIALFGAGYAAGRASV